VCVCVCVGVGVGVGGTEYVNSCGCAFMLRFHKATHLPPRIHVPGAVPVQPHTLPRWHCLLQHSKCRSLCLSDRPFLSSGGPELVYCV
jgi:hypothetical protein